MGKKDSIKLTKRTQGRLCKAIEDGMPYDVACDLSGLPRSTFYAYKAEAEELADKIAKGLTRKPTSQRRIRLLELWDALKKAEARGVQKNLKNISEAGTEPKFWQASAWILERRHPEQFGRNRLDITIKDGPSQLTLDKMIEVVLQKTEGHPDLRRDLAQAFEKIAKAEEDGGEQK